MVLFSLSATAVYTLTLVLFQLLFPSMVSGRNTTIDDQLGDEETGFPVQYQPDGMWQQGADCVTCLLAPNATAAYDGTWHDPTWIGQTTVPLSFSLFFDGEATAAYVVFILALGSDVAEPMVAVTLNGESVGSYQYESSSSDAAINYAYNVTMYSNESLVLPESQNMHNLTITSFGGALFDYAMYTTPDDLDQLPSDSTSGLASSSSSSAVVSTTSTADASSTPSSSSDSASNSATSLPTSSTSSSTSSSSADGADFSGGSSNKRATVAVIAGVSGALAFLALCLVAFLFWRRRRQRREHMFVDLIDSHAIHPEAFPIPFILPSTIPKAEEDVPQNDSKSFLDNPPQLRAEMSSRRKHTKDELTKLRERLSRLEAQQRGRATPSGQSPPPLYDQLTVRSYGPLAKIV